jgi:exosome complex component MTR3
MVGVYGPRQSERRIAFSEEGRINVDVKVATFATRQRGSFYQSPEEKELSAQVRIALSSVIMVETFPKAVIDVFCTILEAGGSETAATITAASLAVADAGVEMKDVVTACEVARVAGTTLLLDPSAEEINREDGGVMAAVCGKNGSFAATTVRGRWEDDELRDALELCLGGCEQLDAAARKSLIKAAIEDSDKR